MILKDSLKKEYEKQKENLNKPTPKKWKRLSNIVRVVGYIVNIIVLFSPNPIWVIASEITRKTVDLIINLKH